MQLEGEARVEEIRASFARDRQKLLTQLVNETKIGGKLTYCRRGHKLAGENIYWYRGYRKCRACRKLRRER